MSIYCHIVFSLKTMSHLCHLTLLFFSKMLKGLKIKP